MERLHISGVELLKGKYRTIAELDFNKIMLRKSNNDQDNGQKYTLCFVPGSDIKVNERDKYLLNKGLFRKIK